MKISDLVRGARERCGMSLQGLADATGVSKGHLHDIEKGATINVGLIPAIRLSVALGIPVNALAASALESLEHQSAALRDKGGG